MSKLRNSNKVDSVENQAFYGKAIALDDVPTVITIITHPPTKLSTRVGPIRTHNYKVKFCKFGIYVTAYTSLLPT